MRKTRPRSKRNGMPLVRSPNGELRVHDDLSTVNGRRRKRAICPAGYRRLPYPTASVCAFQVTSSTQWQLLDHPSITGLGQIPTVCFLGITSNFPRAHTLGPRPSAEPLLPVRYPQPLRFFFAIHISEAIASGEMSRVSNREVRACGLAELVASPVPAAVI